MSTLAQLRRRLDTGGKICPKHPELKGLRGKRNRGCVECVRERTRARRAKIGPKPRKRTPRQIAAAAGRPHYTSAKPCRHGHHGPRLTSSGSCLECKLAANRRLWDRRALAAETLKELGIDLNL
jgi:hypothetical protein